MLSLNLLQKVQLANEQPSQLANLVTLQSEASALQSTATQKSFLASLLNSPVANRVRVSTTAQSSAPTVPSEPTASSHNSIPSLGSVHSGRTVVARTLMPCCMVSGRSTVLGGSAMNHAIEWRRLCSVLSREARRVGIQVR